MTETKTEATVQPWIMAEPDYFTPPSTPWARAAWEQQIAERELRREEREKRERDAERAQQREEYLLDYGMAASWNAGQPYDPMRPFQHVPPVQALADQDFRWEAARERAEAARLLEQHGFRRSLLKPTEKDLPLEQPEAATEFPDDLMWAAKARISHKAKLRHKIARILRPAAMSTGRTVASRSASADCGCASCEYQSAVDEMTRSAPPAEYVTAAEFVSTAVERGYITRRTNDPGRIL